nr:hypothetical protein [Tanacetum cinerariifolium]
MDPNPSIGKICLVEDNRVSLNDRMESHGDWETPDGQDTTCNKQKKEAKAFTFYRMEIEEVSERYIAPCFVNGLKAYDGEINLEQDKKLISNEFAVKLCLEHEVKDGDKVVKKELIVSLRGNGVITIYAELDPFFDNSDKTKKSKDDWELILDGIDFGNILELEDTSLPPFVLKMGKNARNKRRLFENHHINYFDEGQSLKNRQPLTQEEAAREAIAIDIYKRFSIFEEARPVIESMAYSDKYKKILDSIFLDKQKLDGEIKKEKEAVKKVMGEALKEKEDPGAFVIPIRLEAKINLNALADTGYDINVMPFRVYAKLAHTSVNTEESDSDEVEEYSIKKNSFRASIYGLKSLKYLNCTDPMDHALAFKKCYIHSRKFVFGRNLKEDGDGQWQAEIRLTYLYGNIYDQAGSSSLRPKRARITKNVEEAFMGHVLYDFLMWGNCNKTLKTRYNTNLTGNLPKQLYSPFIMDWTILNTLGCGNVIEDMLEVRINEMGSDEMLFTSEA